MGQGRQEGRNIPKETNVRTSLHNSLHPTVDWWDVAGVTIDIFPDVALLTIFAFYVDEVHIEAWHTLVHVCRKWRTVVFESPRRLDLQLHCNAKTPVREMLDIWPPLPIVIWESGNETLGNDNIIAALEHNDRICKIDLLNIPRSQSENVLAAINKPFPALTRLDLGFKDEIAPVDPVSFLDGSAPSLQTLILYRVPFPGLPKLLLSATHLVHLELLGIPHSGYISPEAMATCLSALTRLETLILGFGFLDQKSRRPPPLTRILLPILTELWFKGVGGYFDDLVARIDAPLLSIMRITFFHQLILDTPQLSQFISRTPKFKTHNKARMAFSKGVSVTLPQTLDGSLHLGMSCRYHDWQLSSLAQVCSSFPHALISMVEHLYISGSSRLPWPDDIENSQWLELLHPFAAVKDLYISLEFVPRILPALQELIGERATEEVLPALQTLFLDEPLASGPVQDIIVQFVTARQLAGHPIAVSRWEFED